MPSNLSIFRQKILFLNCNELLQDLAVNYQSEKLYCDFLNPILSLSEYISESATDFMHPVSFPSLDTGTSLSELWSDFQIRFSEVQPLMLKFLANEIFSDLVTPDSYLEDLLIRIQWIALEYSAIRQSLFYNGFRITGVHLHLKWFAGHSLSSQE